MCFIESFSRETNTAPNRIKRPPTYLAIDKNSCKNIDDNMTATGTVKRETLAAI